MFRRQNFMIYLFITATFFAGFNGSANRSAGCGDDVSLQLVSAFRRFATGRTRFVFFAGIAFAVIPVARFALAVARGRILLVRPRIFSFRSGNCRLAERIGRRAARRTFQTRKTKTTYHHQRHDYRRNFNRFHKNLPPFFHNIIVAPARSTILPEKYADGVHSLTFSFRDDII